MNLTWLFASTSNNSIQGDISNISDKVSSFDIHDYIPTMMNWGVRIVVLLLIYFVGKKLIDIAVLLFDKVAQRNNLDISVAGFIRILIRWILYILMACMILDYLDIGTASLVAVLGSAGLAIGLSLQGSLANFAGSLIILIMKPFKIGDYIVTSSGEGTVKLIGLIYTTLTTVDNREVHIPNGSLANTDITNVTANTTRLVCLPVDISYDSDIKKAKDLITKLMSESPYRIPNTDVLVFVSNLGESSVVIEGRVTVSTADYWPAVRSMKEEIKMIYDQEGIEIPYNQLDVHMR